MAIRDEVKGALDALRGLGCVMLLAWLITAFLLFCTAPLWLVAWCVLR